MSNLNMNQDHAEEERKVKSKTERKDEILPNQKQKRRFGLTLGGVQRRATSGLAPSHKDEIFGFQLWGDGAPRLKQE